MNDLELGGPLGRGDGGAKVRLVQEWLSLHGLGVKIDGDFGPATEAAVKQFQKSCALAATGVVEALTFQRLVAPMTAALATVAPERRSLGQLVVAYAERHLAQRPREIGGQNLGPWVRLYTGGHEGLEWAWCAGFACFCLRQACGALGVALPIVPSLSCDSLAASAKARKRLLRAPSATARPRIKPGSLFLSVRTPTDWTHCGIVVQPSMEAYTTIEGNTNDEGSREGYEVCARTRGYDGKDFVLIE